MTELSEYFPIHLKIHFSLLNPTSANKEILLQRDYGVSSYNITGTDCSWSGGIHNSSFPTRTSERLPQVNVTWHALSCYIYLTFTSAKSTQSPWGLTCCQFLHQLQLLNSATSESPVLLTFELVFLLVALISSAYFKKLSKNFASSKIKNLVMVRFQKKTNMATLLTGIFSRVKK